MILPLKIDSNSSVDSKLPEFRIWEGIYDSFGDADADAIGPGFRGCVYRGRALNVASECLAALNTGRPIPPFHKQRSALLPPVAAMMLERKSPLRILDLGGGLGIGYMTLAESISHHAKLIEYTIVEVPEICEAGRGLFSGERVTFVGSLPSQGKFDLVHSASALQYIEDWQQVLRSLSGYGAEYMLFSDVFAGSIPTFATLQNYYGSRIPHWFLNLDELLEIVASTGYRQVMKSFVNSRRLETEDVIPMDNFPQTHRLEQTLHLLVRRDA
jgi:putative methyltransferase (TIGR04325 family)